MSASITVEEAQARLAELIDRLRPGEEIVLTQNQQPVAKLVGQRSSERQPRVPGNCKGMITLAVEDDEHLKDFDILSHLLGPVGRMMPVDFAQKLAALRAGPEIQARIVELADRNNEGELTDKERADYQAYVDAIDLISILQAQARAVIARQPSV